MPVEHYYVKPSGITTSGEFETVAAAARFGKTPIEFKELHGEDQSYMVAFYRTEQLIQAVLSTEAERPQTAHMKR